MRSRRSFLAAGGRALGAARAERREAAARGVPVVHVTDLYRPHQDPDDHWDLACVFALAQAGDYDLKAVLMDAPPRGKAMDPDVMAVAQMNALTGLAVPALAGSRAGDEGGVRALEEMLRGSKRPVVVHVVGSARDVALAARKEPRLWEQKCAGVYLNAGSGTRDRGKAADLEYNVGLDPASYAAMFELPCPVYWMPCFEHAKGPFRVAEWGTYYTFRHEDVLPGLTPRLRNYFAWMYRHGKRERAAGGESWNWLRALEGPQDEETLRAVAPTRRAMWCTAGFLHAAGKTVTREGRIVARGAGADEVLRFEPVKVKCSAEGITEWERDAKARGRFLFHVLDVERYEAAMTAALRTLLGTLR